MNLRFTFIFLSCLVITISGKYTGPTNQAGLNLIKEFEGFYGNFYTDPVGIRTIGYGHACHAHDCSVPLEGKYSVPLTRSSAEALLKDDLVTYESCVNNAITYNGLTANQFSALVSFTFNVGCGNLRSSTLRTLLNQGNVAGAAGEFPKWNKGGGKVLPGLVRRRAAEQVLFNSNSDGGSGGQCFAQSTTTGLRIRSAPNTSSSVAGSLSNGERVEVLGRVQGTSVSGNANWFRLRNGYVSAFYMQIVTSNGESWCAR